MNGPYVRRMIPELGDPDREVPTTLLGLPEEIYVAVDSCETAKEIWLRVQQMMKVSDIRAQEKKAKLFNEWERFTSTDGESIESYYHRFSKLMNNFKRNKHFPEKIASNLKNQVVQNAIQNLGIQNVGNQNGLIVVPGIANLNTNQNGNGIVVATRVEGNGNGNNRNQIRCYNCRGMGHLARNYTVRPKRRDAAYLQT
ncbi:integrase, catalytic region, zinc finger, CCHC-type containing protein [Tanacetum coccineum]